MINNEELKSVTQLRPVTLLKSAAEQARIESEINKQIEALQTDIESDEALIAAINIESVEVKLLPSIEFKLEQLKEKLAQRKLGLQITRLLNIKGGNRQAAEWLEKEIDSMENIK
jgi:hypothetical protein